MVADYVTDSTFGTIDITKEAKMVRDNNRKDTRTDLKIVWMSPEKELGFLGRRWEEVKDQSLRSKNESKRKRI